MSIFKELYIHLAIRSALCDDANMKLLRSIQDVAVVVVGKELISLIPSIPAVFSDLSLPVDNIKSIVICDKDKTKAKKLFSALDFSRTKFQEPILYFVKTIENHYPKFPLTIIISSDRSHLDGIFGYGISMIFTHNSKLEFNSRTSLIGLRFKDSDEPIKISDFCETRRTLFEKTMSAGKTEKGFYLALDEANNGCETCPFCENYDSDKGCPFFQLKIAEFYETRNIVPTNLPLAIQWKKKAARQGFKEAEISLAETYIKHPKLMPSPDDLFELLTKHAEKGDIQATRDLINYASSAGRISLALPWYARLANSGDYSAQNSIIDFYSNGGDGILSSKEEENRWIEVAIGSGNRDYISGIVESYIQKEEWATAIKWYYRLRGDESYDEEKLVTLFERYCESEELDSDDYVNRGNQFYYGIDAEESPRLAYFCFMQAHYFNNHKGTEGVGRCLIHGKGVEKDQQSAIDNYLIPAAEAGEFQSMVQLFEYYSCEEIDEESAEFWKRKAVEALDHATINRDPEAMRLKSLGLSEGNLYDKDEILAFKLMEESASHGDVLAKYYLGQYYCHGTGISVDKERAFEIFCEMDHRGIAMAGKCIGCCYLEGYAVSKDNHTSFEWFMKAAKRKDAGACYKVGWFYERGIDVDASCKTAHEWYLIAAKEGNKAAQCKLGENYYLGKGVKKDWREAKKWYVKAANQGETDSYFRAAYLCAASIDGVTEYAKAFKWYSYLAEQGNRAAKNNLGVMYSEGNGVSVDKAKAFSLFLEAAEGGSPVAMDNTARNYLHGSGVCQDPLKAIEWFEKGLSRGFLACGLNLAKEYMSGKYIDMNIHKAIEILDRVLELPHDDDMKATYVESVMTLADLYYYGKDDHLAQDNEKAFHLYKKAAEEGDSLAYYRLGTMYEYGYYVSMSIPQAVYWYRLAAEKNYEPANNKLTELCSDPITNDELPF